ncbi:thioredoxin family protein [Pseudalkalibacillus decolorationis]|uniref:thioredoxin family protein n=1 Tax=Pseudalkalibacillus decolorationis TaxID=163879 RepID=UPI002147DA17|nr:thioredoxin family protein [Pseudalkalibacillus decolorationis]
MEEIRTKSKFNELIDSEEKSVIKFETDWCPDCRRLDMFIGDIMQEHNDKQWHQIDKDAFPELAEKYEVMGIPSLLVFKNGEKIGHLHSANAKTPESVREFLSSLK